MLPPSIREPRCFRVVICDQPFSGGVEVVKHILLFLEHSGVVPIFAEFAAAAKIGDGIHAALLHPCNCCRAVGWFEIHVEAAVRGEISGIVAVEFHSFEMGDEHRNLCAVFRYVPDLLHREFVWIDRHVAARPDGLFAGGCVIAVDRGWHEIGIE